MSPAKVMIAGALIAFVAFCFGIWNFTHIPNSSGTDPFGGFGTMFKRHLGMMVGMASGGLVFFIGLIMALTN